MKTIQELIRNIESILWYYKESKNAERALDLIEQIVDNPEAEYCMECECFHTGECKGAV